jgi:hypothetical protein
MDSCLVVVSPGDLWCRWEEFGFDFWVARFFFSVGIWQMAFSTKLSARYFSVQHATVSAVLAVRTYPDHHALYSHA